MRKHSKLKKGIGITILCVLPVLSCLWGSKIFPWTWRWFICYGFFYQTTGTVAGHYPEKLPSSAENVSYYYYTGMFDTKTAVSFILDGEEYEDQKKRYLLLYTADEEENHQEYLEEWLSEYGEIPDWAEKWESDYVFDKKLTSDFLEEEELEYLEKVFHESADRYTILAYKGDAEGGERCYLEGVFCNDETNEVVMFGFTDMFRKSRK